MQASLLTCDGIKIVMETPSVLNRGMVLLLVTVSSMIQRNGYSVLSIACNPATI